MKKQVLIAVIAVVALSCTLSFVQAQGTAPADPGRGELATSSGQAAPAPAPKQTPGFFSVVAGSGPLGILLWLSILASSIAMIYFVVDCSITIRVVRVMPQTLIDSVTESMEQGDVLKALDCCEREPGPMANILTAGFSHVEEGFEVIQESIAASAELESERLIQKIAYLSVVGNLAPMLGLLGTVQGMIAAFDRLGSAAGGVVQVNLLAMDISQALFTTAAGLSIAVPAVAAFYIFRNKANTIILRMEAITIDLIKDLRNVEVVDEEEV